MMSLSRQDFLFHYCLVIDLSNCSATGEESLALILFQRHKQTFFAAFATLKKENVCGRDHKGKRVGQTFWDTVHRNRPRKNGKSSVSMSGKKNPLLLFLGSYPATRRSTNLDFQKIVFLHPIKSFHSFEQQAKGSSKSLLQKKSVPLIKNPQP